MNKKNLEELMRELGEAINAALSESPRILQVMEDARQAGYDGVFVLETTFGFNTDEEEPPGDEGRENPPPPPKPPPKSKSRSRKKPDKISGEIKLTPQDQKFLKAFKITTDD